jgi:zinc and cadmium transporter
MTSSVYAIASVVLISSVSLIGILFFHKKAVPKESGNTSSTVVFDKERLSKLLPFLVSFAVGGLFGDSFIHLLPEAFENLGANLSTSLSIVFGLLFFFALEKFIRWKHCHDLDYAECSIKSAATMTLIGDGIHNLIDGMLIGASYCVSIPIGITTTLAVFFHEIPQEIGDFGILVHSGYSIKKAVLFNMLTGLTAVLGAVISLILGPRIEGYAVTMLPFTAGGFIYVAGSDLIPELHREVKISSSIWQFISITLGIAVMALLTLLE